MLTAIMSAVIPQAQYVNLLAPVVIRGCCESPRMKGWFYWVFGGFIFCVLENDVVTPGSNFKGSCAGSSSASSGRLGG